MGMFWRIAASVVLLLSAGYLLYFLSGTSTPETIKVIAQTETRSDTLPDGSSVFLNKGTELTYVYDASSKHHKVKLKGEAFFEVAPDKKNEFLIEIEDVFIEDIGTSFNVKAYPEKNTIEVVVTEGKVRFYTSTDSGVYLSENGKGVYDKSTKRFAVDQPEPNVLSYKTRLFTFSDTDLHTAVAALNEVYDKKIILGHNLQNCRLTVSFNNENINEIAAIMAETLGLTVATSADGIRLEGSGCEK
jgi:ferric-dicitrate binding protein FerR (iron transport regulator)